MSINRELAAQLAAIGEMLELLGENRFRVNAYNRAARAIESMDTDLAELADDKSKLVALEGIGDKMADKIIEFSQSGNLSEFDEMCAKVPDGVLALMSIQGLGPKTISLLWKEKDITDLDGLKRIIADGTILELPRMGARSVEKLKSSIEIAETADERLRLGPAQHLADRLVGELESIKGVKQVAFAGSLRRGQETVGDIDILVATTDPKRVSKAFVENELVERVLASGDTKSSVRMEVPAAGGRIRVSKATTVQVDLRVIDASSWGAALMYFTGSKEHNVRMRERALKKKLTLNEYGLFPNDDDPKPPQQRGIKPVASTTETSIFEALDLPYMPPEIRQDRGEFALTETPRLVEITDIKAELHAHTTASDGKYSITELAQQAKDRGFHTIAVTDHSKSSFQANGLDEKRLGELIGKVRKANSADKDIQILAGSEVDILVDGKLDYNSDILQELDIVVASPHASLAQDPAKATKRLCRALESGYVHILGHPTGRLIGRRDGLDPDMKKVIEAAIANNVALEINAHWMRLDLRDRHVRMAVDAGALIAIDTDAHDGSDFENLRFGVATARRGWVEPERCVNTWSLSKLNKWLKR